MAKIRNIVRIFEGTNIASLEYKADKCQVASYKVKWTTETYKLPENPEQIVDQATGQSAPACPMEAFEAFRLICENLDQKNFRPLCAVSTRPSDKDDGTPSVAATPIQTETTEK